MSEGSLHFANCTRREICFSAFIHKSISFSSYNVCVRNRYIISADRPFELLPIVVVSERFVTEYNKSISKCHVGDAHRLVLPFYFKNPVMDSVNKSGYDQSIDWVPLSLTFVEYPKGNYLKKYKNLYRQRSLNSDTNNICALLTMMQINI